MLSFQITDAAELIEKALGKGGRTIREWRITFNSNRWMFPGTLQEKYQRDGVLWNNEHLNKKATNYVRENTVKKGKA